MNDLKNLQTDNLKSAHRKEGNPRHSIQAYLKDQTSEEYSIAIITIDVFEPKRYKTGMERVTACLWVNDSKNNTFISGSDYAGGCGYHKGSAAIYGAFASAGIECESFAGHGDRAVIEAVHQVMAALDYKKSEYIVVSR